MRRRERLSPADASFLAADRGAAYGTPGFLLAVSGKQPTLEELRRHMEGCVELVPRLRQRLRRTPLQIGRPWWQDDPAFDVGWHVNRLRVSGERELGGAVERIFSQRLDETKPLWELWLIDGHADERFAVVFKTHHCLGDGVSFGRHFTRVLLDGPAPAAARTGPPVRAAAPLRGAVGLLELARDWLGRPAPRAPLLNEPLSAQRRMAFATRALDDYLAPRQALGGTLNDVFLTALAGGLRRWLDAHAHTLPELSVGLPASLRRPGDESALGNRMSLLRLALPLEPAEPLARHRAVVARTDRIKRSRQLDGTRAVTLIDHLTPARALGGTLRLHTSRRFFNLIASSLPGPPEPLSLLGRPVRQIHACNILLASQRLIVTLTTYADQACLSLVADRGLPGVGELREAIDDELDGLRAAIPGPAKVAGGR